MNLKHHIDAQIELLTLVREHGTENVEWRMGRWTNKEEYQSLEEWVPSFSCYEPEDTYCFRVRPAPTYSIHADGLPAPETEAPEDETRYFVPNPGDWNWYDSIVWNGDSRDYDLLERGVVHLNKENAIIHSRAMLPGVSNE